MTEHHDDFSVVINADAQQKPIPATVVSDKRDTLGKRLAILGVGLLLIFSSVGGWIQSASNGQALKDANKNRSGLTETVKLQNDYIIQLQKALLAQASALIAAGQGDKVVPVPPAPPLPPGASPRPSKSSEGLGQPEPSPAPPVTQPSPTRSPPSSPRPPPPPQPTPTPLIPHICTTLVPALGEICI